MTDLSSWDEMIAIEPQLADLADAVATSHPPTTMPGYGRCYIALMGLVEELTQSPGAEAFRVARDHVHRTYTNVVLLNSMTPPKGYCA